LVATLLVDVPNWRILFGLSGAISLIQIVWLPFMPESPKYLVTKGKIAEGAKALQFLRPNCDITSEFSNLLESCSAVSESKHSGNTESSVFTDTNSECNVAIANKQKEQGKSKRKTASIHSVSAAKSPMSIGLVDIIKGKTPDVIWHTLFCTMFLMGFQQWTGAKGIVFYSTEILVRVFNLSDAQLRKTPNEAQWMTIGLAAAGIVAVFVSMNLIDRLGRRRLLLISTCGISISCLLVVIGRVFDIAALAVAAMFSFKLAYGLGMAPIPWLTASEMLPYYALGTLSGIASALNWMMIFIIGLVFPLLAKALNNYLFLPFAALNFSAFLVVFLFVPETKGRHISDILHHHGRSLHIVCSLSKWRRRRQDTQSFEDGSF
ncbi:Bifunctional purine biosynthesis protein PurH, partial [Coemansia erecta]